MATYDEIINLKVKGGQALINVEKSLNRIKAVTKELTSFSYTDLTGGSNRAGSGTAGSLGTNVADKFRKEKTALKRQITLLSNYGDALRKIRIEENRFNKAGKSSYFSEAAQKARTEDLKRLTGDSPNQQNNPFPKTLQAATEQADILGGMLREVGLKTKNSQKDAVMFAKAFEAANENVKVLKQNMNEVSRSARGLIPQKQRDAEVARRSARVSSLRTRRQRGTRFREDLMLGAGFPLLFGGGLGGVAGGVGGAVFERTRKRPTGGFGAQILFSAVGQRLQQSVEGIAKLGQALNPFTANIDQLTKSLGLAGTAEGQRIKLIETLSGKQAALAEATRVLSRQVGEAGAKSIKAFGEKFQSIGNSVSKIFTKLGSIFATLLNPLVGVVDSLLQLTDTVLGRITRFFNNIFDKGKDADITIPVSPTNNQQIDALFAGQFKSASEEKSFLRDSIKLGSEQAEIKKKVFEFSEKIKEVTKDMNTDEKLALFDNEQKLANHLEEINLLKRQAELFENIRSTIANGMVNAVEALIDRTKSLNEVLASVVKQIGRAFLNAGINALVGNISFGGAPANNIQPLPKLNRITGNPGPRTAPIRPRATGGFVTRPELSLISEAGENEYVIPASKMSTAMQRYSSGVRGQSVIPGTGSSQSVGGGGGSTTVNYSGPILTFNSEEFVPKAAVGAIIASATSQGAAMGETRTIRAMQNRRSIRTRVGI